MSTHTATVHHRARRSLSAAIHRSQRRRRDGRLAKRRTSAEAISAPVRPAPRRRPRAPARARCACMRVGASVRCGLCFGRVERAPFRACASGASCRRVWTTRGGDPGGEQLTTDARQAARASTRNRNWKRRELGLRFASFCGILSIAFAVLFAIAFAILVTATIVHLTLQLHEEQTGVYIRRRRTTDRDCRCPIGLRFAKKQKNDDTAKMNGGRSVSS